MPNSVTELYRKYLADTGQTDDRSDYEITDQLGRWASQNNPALFDQHPDFGQEFGAIREANAPSLGSEFGSALKSGTIGLGSTALGGLSLLTGSDALRNKALELEQKAAEAPPTVGTLEDIAPGRKGLESLFSRDALRYGVSKLGSVAPSIGEALVTGTAGAMMGSAAAPGPGTAAGAASGLVAKGLVKSAIRSLLRKGAAESMVERGLIGEASEAALEQAVKQSIPTVTDLVGREAMAIGARRGLAATNLANSFLLNAGDVYSENPDRATAAGLGLISAIPDSFLPTYVIGRLFPGVEKGAARELAKSYVANKAMKALEAAGVVGTEAATEYFQEGVNVVARNLKEGKDALTFTPDDLKRFREAGIAGAFGGGIAAPGILIAPKETTQPAATPETEFGTMAKAGEMARVSIAQQQQAEQQRLANEAEAAKNTEAARLLAEQQAAIQQGLSAQEVAQRQAQATQEAEAARLQRSALGMVGETPESAQQREAQRAALEMAGAKPLDMTDPAQAAAQVGRAMTGNVPVEQAAPVDPISIARQVLTMDATQYYEWAQAQPGGQTATSDELGKAVTGNLEALQELRAAQQSALAQFEAARAAGDLDGASVLASKPQFFREAIEVAEKNMAALPPATVAAVAATPAPVPDAAVPEAKAESVFVKKPNGGMPPGEVAGGALAQEASVTEPAPAGATEITLYHGGPKISGDLKEPAFLTTDRQGAQWYANERGGETPTVTQFTAEISNPLNIDESDGIRIMMNAAKDAGVPVEITGEIGVQGWEFFSPEIKKHGPYDGGSVADLAYVPKVRSALRKLGYDAIRVSDMLSNDFIETFIVLDPKKLKPAKPTAPTQQPPVPAATVENAGSKASRQESVLNEVEDRIQLLKDSIDTKRANNKPIPEPWIKRLGELQAQVRGERNPDNSVFSAHDAPMRPDNSTDPIIPFSVTKDAAGLESIDWRAREAQKRLDAVNKKIQSSKGMNRSELEIQRGHLLGAMKELGRMERAIRNEPSTPPPSAEQRKNDAGSELPSISRMPREAKRTPDITYRTTPAVTAIEATRTAQFNAAVSSLQSIGASVQAFSKEMLAQNTRDIINQRIAALQQESQASQDPAVQQELGRRLAVLQERASAVDQAQGVTYAPNQIALAMDDIGNATASNLVTLIHEAAESLTMRMTPEQQGAVSSAVNAAVASIRARAAEAASKTGVPLATESSPEDLLAETLAQEMTARGVPEAPSLAEAIVRWVKDVYYRTAMAMQAAFGAEPNPETALAWFENQLSREVGGDYSYAFANLLDKYLPSPMKERVRRFSDPRGTPGGIADFIDPANGTPLQPQVETLDRDSLNWNMQFRQLGNPGQELDIPDPEARARTKGAMLNALAEFYETLRGQVAPDMPPANFFQQIKRMGEVHPSVLLADLDQRFPGAGTARIGGERMTEAMTREAQVELWSRLRKFGLANRRKVAQDTKTIADGETLLSSRATSINKLEADIRNAAMHEDILKLSAKDLVSELARGMTRGYGTSHLQGELAEAIREEEKLLASDQIPEHYQNVLENLYAGGISIFEYVRAIADLDLPLADMSVRQIVAEIRKNIGGSDDLNRLAQNKPLTVALATLARKNAEQVDQIQLGWLRDTARFKQIYEQLEQIKQGNAASLREIRREMDERGKVAGLLGRLKASYLAKRQKQQALSDRLTRAEERKDLLEKLNTPVDERTEQAAQDAGGAQYEWTPQEGATWAAMKQGENGAWRRVNRVLRYNPDGSAVDGDQLRQDLTENLEWLRTHQEDAGKPRYNQVEAQTYALRLLDAKGQQQRTWNSGTLRAVDHFVRTPIATARSIGGPAMQRIVQMLNKYQFIQRSYQREMEVPAAEWQSEFVRLRDASGLKDNGEFLSQVYGPAMYFIATNPGLEEGPAIRQAMNLVRRSLPSPREDFSERFTAFLRKTKEAEQKLLNIAEQYGVFVQDKRLGPQLRRAVARGWLTGMRSLNGGIVDVITKDMQQAGWRLTYNEVERNGRMVKTDIKPGTFDSLTEESAASDTAIRPLIQRLFTPEIVGKWLEPFIRKTGQEPFAHKGDVIPQETVQEAWNEAGDDVLAWIDRLGLKIGGVDKAKFRLSMLNQLDNLFGHEAKLAYDASQTPNILDPHGPKPHALMDARVSDLLPAEHVRFETYEPDSMHQLVARIAYHGAFGRNAKNIQAAFAETMAYLQGMQAQWQTLTNLHTTEDARKAEAKRRGWNYDDIENAAARYKDAREFKDQVEAVLGVSAKAGPFGDLSKGLTVMNFITGQIVDNPKTAFYNLLSPAMRPFAQRSLGPTAISNTVRTYGDLLYTGMGSLFQSFGLNLFKASDYAKTIGNAEGRAFSNLPYGVVTADIGHAGDNQAGWNKWLVKPLRIARQIQRKGLQLGGGAATDFPRMSVIPGLGVINTLSQIEQQAAGASLAQELESLVLKGINYMAAHPEAANNPSFRFKPSDLYSIKADHELFNWWQQKLIEYNMGNFEDIVRDAAKRQAESPQSRLLTQDQALTMAMLNANELSLNSSVNTTPAWLMQNKWAQMAMPLIRWPLAMMSSVHEAAKHRPGENPYKPALRALGTLALWNLPIGLAFTLLMDEYDKRLTGKKSNLPNLDKTAALPIIGLPLSLATADKPLNQIESMLIRMARAGNVYGLGADVAAQFLAGLDPTTGQRAFSLDQRVLAYSQLASMGQALLNWKDSGQADWGSVGRPVMMAMGGNGALHSVDVANHLLGLDNAQSRLTERAAAANWIRSAAQELDIEVKKAAFSGTATPLSANTRQMYLAALANDRADFLDAYRRALAAARVRVAQDSDVKPADREREAINRVLSSWRSRNPMAVLVGQPTDAQIAHMLSIMDPQGQENVRTALSRFKSFSDLIEPTPMDRYMRRQISAQQRQFDPEALRRRMSSGSLMFSTR